MRRFILWLDEAAAFHGVPQRLGHQLTGEVRAKYLRRTSIRARRRGRLEATGAVGTNGGHAVEGGSRLLEARGDRLSGSVMEQAA